MKFIKKLWEWLNQEVKPEDIICPVCGYYCSGRGGFGCIDKPFYNK
jgi:hypothetical protein